MGMQTFIVLSNNDIDRVLKNPEKFLHDLMLATNSGKPMDLGSGAGRSLGCRHTHDPALVLFTDTNGTIIGSANERRLDLSDDDAVMEVVKEIMRGKRYKVEKVRGY